MLVQLRRFVSEVEYIFKIFIFKANIFENSRIVNNMHFCRASLNVFNVFFDAIILLFCKCKRKFAFHIFMQFINIYNIYNIMYILNYIFLRKYILYISVSTTETTSQKLILQKYCFCFKLNSYILRKSYHLLYFSFDYK